MFDLIHQRVVSLLNIKNKNTFKIEVPVFDIQIINDEVVLEQVGTIFESTDISETWNKIKFYNYMLKVKVKLYLDRDIIIRTKSDEIKLKGQMLCQLLESDGFTLNFWMLKKLQVQLKLSDSVFTLYLVS
jgi:alpha-N-acetylglucosamine transferase